MANPLLTIADYEARAREIIPVDLFARQFGTYGDSDRMSETNNIDAFDAAKLRPRVLVDVSHRNLATKVLGHDISFPVMTGPSGIHQRGHPQGELATARAAGTAGTIMGLSTVSSYSIEEVAAVATGPLWFQLYFFQDRELNKILVQRAERAGFSALFLTVDNLGARSHERETRYAYFLEVERLWKNLDGIDLPNLPKWYNFAESYDRSLSWSDLDWLRSITKLPLVIKGIQTAADARLCVEHGADALIVSNHGGNAANGVTGTIEILPEVRDVVGDQLEVYLDGGIRRGTDVLKSLALGAKAVLIGRAVFWGLAVDADAGVHRVLEILRDELDVAMGLCGVADVNSVDRSLVVAPNGKVGGSDLVDQLEGLAGLLEKGYLTREEFEIQKGKLLVR